MWRVLGGLSFVALVGGCYTSDLVDAAASLDGGGGNGDSDAGEPLDGSANDASPRDSGTDAAKDTCSDGSPIIARLTSCNATPSAASAALATSLATRERGEVASLGSAASAPASDCFPVRVCTPPSAPPMLFSDSPESPTTSGVLYADTVGPGRYRIYVYHTNGANDGIDRKFPIVVLNQGATDGHATIVQKGIAGPSLDYVTVGKAAASRWLASASSPAASVTVPSGQRVVLDPELDAVAAGYQQLVNAIYDVELDAKMKVSVVAVTSTEDAATRTASLSLLAADSDHQRATFVGADRTFEVEGAITAAGVTHLSFGGNTVDANLAGTDATNGNAAALVGNYGVFYTFRGVVAGKSAFAFAPRGGSWGGAGDVSTGADGIAGAVSFPTATGATPADGSGIVVGRFATGANVEARFMSAGGSSLPVSLVSIPLP